VDVAQAGAIAAAVRGRAGPRPQIVGLFVNEAPAQIAQVARAVGLDLIQLSGDEPAEQAAALGRPLLRSLRMDSSAREAAWVALAAAGGPRLLVDAHVAGAYGGTGARADWARAAELARALPIMLAGGLDHTNVGAAIAQVRPWGVDVSSGVETDGLKDAAKIAAFVAAAREAGGP
jgi:phosphoribosylanthranilate isomerase